LIASKEIAVANLSDQLHSCMIELRGEQDSRAELQVAIKELDSKLARMSMDALKSSDSLAIANRNFITEKLEMEREIDTLRMQLERSADQSTSERDTFQRKIDLILTENLHLKSQAKLDFEAQLKEFEKQLTVLEQSNHELSDRLVVVEMERAELAAALDSTRHKNSKSSTSVDPQSLSAGLPGDNSAERDSARAQLVQAQQKIAVLELDLANMKQRLLVPFEHKSG
jgi:hypothetical protein